MKFINKSKTLPYTLCFCLVIVFSFAASYCLTWLVREPVPATRVSAVNHRQLFKNYRFLNYFLLDNFTASWPGMDAADLNHPLLSALERLERARQLAKEKKYAPCREILLTIPSQFPLVAVRRDELQLRCLYAIKKFAGFVTYYDSHAVDSLEIKVMLLNCLQQSNQPGRAQQEFAALFQSHRLAPFRQMMAPGALSGLLRRLDEDFWFNKFSFLVKNNDRAELARELPLCRFLDLARLFRAEHAYLAREYAKAGKLLQTPLAIKYRPPAEKILLKIAIRLDPQADIMARLQAIKKNSRLYPDLLFEAAQILVSQGDFERALPFYAQYLQLSQDRSEEYWKTIWLLAWIHYRQDRRDLALTFFQKGSQSPFLNYQIASRYWQSKLENGKQPQPQFAYPYSYYAVKVLQHKSQFKNLKQTFISSIDKAPSPRFMEIFADLKLLAKYGLHDECLETIHAAKSDARLQASDLNLLKIIESLIHFQQNRFFLAYAKFRSNFRHPEKVQLPNFLSGIFFPRQYSGLIETYSREQEVDPYLVMALIREESFFRPDSVSPAKAYGLMQLLHSTAREVARNSALKIKARDLYDPELNIRLGLQYLKTLLDKYDGRLYLALAAYNAGPHRVERWLQDYPGASEDEFIEMIPFTETRNYVKKILRNYFFYRYYYEKS